MSMLRKRLRNSRTFLIILSLTALVWLCVAMADEKIYSYPVKVELVGVDTTRYVIVQQDTLLPLELQSSGFAAVARSVVKKPVVKVQVRTSSPLRRAVATRDCIDEVLSQLNLKGIRSAASPKDSLVVLLSERSSRRYRPMLSAVQFTFDAGYGLCGEIVVEPNEVVLYGSEASLREIDHLSVSPTTIPNIASSGSYTLPLEPVWSGYPDVRPSVSQVSITVPVAAYAEKTFTLPLHLVGVDTSQHVRLYPDKVEVTCWVPTEQHARLTAEHLTAEVRLDATASKKALPVVITRFPSYARVKQIQPTEVQYVVIH